MMKLLAAALLLSATPASSAPAAIAPEAAPSLEEAINICRTTLLVDEAKGRKMFQAVPAEHKQAVAVICISYRRGIQDMLDVIANADAKKHEASWTR